MSVVSVSDGLWSMGDTLCNASSLRSNFMFHASCVVADSNILFHGL
jgi:hypothetical protein